jgi:hypothetical protein
MSCLTYIINIQLNLLENSHSLFLYLYWVAFENNNLIFIENKTYELRTMRPGFLSMINQRNE